ncbi:ankyrin repeat-containing domain protein [Aspergillus granulosus]|uniref:Ankyrin repeat-containing domain protein n=1 Tax=Aspergillus granulosus TaxID=176169 RepID=A0ABR4HF10_9EURO
MENTLPFLYAVAMGDTAAIEREWSNNKSILSVRNPEGWTALHLAAFHGHPQVVRLLLSYGMCAAIPDANGQSALHIAAQRSSVEVVEVLLKDGSGCSTRDKDGKTAIAYAYKNPMHDILVRFLDYAPSCGVGCSMTPEIVLGSRPSAALRAKSDSAVPCARPTPGPPKQCCGSVRCQ